MRTSTPGPQMQEPSHAMKVYVMSSVRDLKVLTVHSDVERAVDKTHLGDRCIQLSKISTVPSQFNSVNNFLLFQVHPDVNFKTKVKTQPGGKNETLALISKGWSLYIS